MAQICTKAAGHACAVCHVGRRSDWHDLDEASLALLERGRRRRDYGSGEVVFAQGARNAGVYCVSGGTVGIRRLDSNGNSVLLELAYPGDTIGYRSFLTDSVHKTSAEALGPSVVCHLDRATLTALLAANPAVGLRFLKRSINAVETAHDTMFRQATLSNRHKLVHLLLVLVGRHGHRLANGSQSIDLPVSRRDLASMVGTRHETISRIIGRLETDGIAHFSGRQVTIPSIDALAAELDCLASA
ncbi:MAG TPA: Crp/Fnr family transcriptional regulator [Xanthobacteraceae bacterium]|nr:Crp/Fnr family transcriptional regulator [Xanthobacteraceae bacterium]